MTDKFDQEPSVVSAIESGNIVQAIKLLRASRGIGLKEAKDLVDQYIEAHIPDDNQQSWPEPKINSGSGSKLFLLLIGIVFVGFYFYKKL